MTNPLTDKGAKPTDETLAAVLGRTKRHWDEIVDSVTQAHPGITSEWKFYAGKYGWTFKLLRKRKAALYLAPRRGRFTASMALRESAVTALRSSSLPDELVDEIEQSKAFPEGRPARLDVTNRKHVAIVTELVAIKLAK